MPGALIPSGVEIGCVYTLTAADGSGFAVFNDPTDPNYVGMLTEVTGIDSPDVRESADTLVQMDGGIHGDFYYDRRPITLSGKIINPASIEDRNSKITLIQQVSNAMRGDATLSWTPTGGIEQFIKVRRQQPLRVSGAWVKDFQISLVAADPRIYSTFLHSQSVNAADLGSTAGLGFPVTWPMDFGPPVINGQILITNSGSTESYPVFTIWGPGQNPSVTNASITGAPKVIFNTFLDVGESLTVDTLNRTVILNGLVNRYEAVDFANTTWWPLISGVNDVRLGYYSFSSGASMTVSWRDAWL